MLPACSFGPAPLPNRQSCGLISVRYSFSFFEDEDDVIVEIVSQVTKPILGALFEAMEDILNLVATLRHSPTKMAVWCVCVL